LFHSLLHRTDQTKLLLVDAKFQAKTSVLTKLILALNNLTNRVFI